MNKIVRYAAAIATLLFFVVSAGPVAAADRLGSYRWRADDGTEATATFSAAENAPLASLAKNTPMRLRFGVANSGTDSELLRQAAVALNEDEAQIYNGVIDTEHGYAYFAMYNAPSTVVKVALGSGDDPPVRIGAAVLNEGEDFPTSAVIDTQNGYAYFGTTLSSTDGGRGKVIKVALGSGNASPVRIGALKLDAGEDNLGSAVIDSAGGYAYFAADNKVVKIALGTGDALPTRVGALTLGAGETYPNAGLVDLDNHLAYFGTSTVPGRVVKIALGAGDALPTRVGAVTLDAGEDRLNTSVIDLANGYAYFGTLTSPGRVIKIALGAVSDPPVRSGAVTLAGGENSLYSSVIDSANGYAYFGTDTSPGIVIKIALGTGNAAPARIGAVAMRSGDDMLDYAVIDPAKGYAYFGTFTIPATVIKVSLAPKIAFRLEYGLKETTCGAIASWTPVPAAATVEAWQMAASVNLADGEATTNNAGITDANASFTPGQAKDTGSQTSLVSLGEKQFTELEYSIKATANAAPVAYCFRLTNAGAETAFSVDNYPEVTVAASAVRRSTAGRDTAVTPPAPSISWRIPAADVAYKADAVIGLEWSPLNGAFVEYKISYSSDNGANWTAVKDGVATNSFSWTVPDAGTSAARIKVDGYGVNGVLLATATSGSFSVIGETPPEPEPITNGQNQSADSTVTGAYAPTEAQENNPDFNTEMNLPAAPPFSAGCVSGSLLKTASLPAIYYCGHDGKRYVFVNDKTYFSWYADFSAVQTIGDETMAAIELGGNITYRPGVRLVKIQTDPRVYAVARGGVLRWVATEAAAVRLYGANWNKSIDDLPDVFFVNYKIGAPIE